MLADQSDFLRRSRIFPAFYFADTAFYNADHFSEFGLCLVVLGSDLTKPLVFFPFSISLT